MTRTVDGRCELGHVQMLLNGRLWCPNVIHDGRPATHPLGFLPRTPAFDQPVASPPSGRRATTPSPRRAADAVSAKASASLPAFGQLFPGEGPDAG